MKAASRQLSGDLRADSTLKLSFKNAIWQTQADFPTLQEAHTHAIKLPHQMRSDDFISSYSLVRPLPTLVPGRLCEKVK